MRIRYVPCRLPWAAFAAGNGAQVGIYAVPSPSSISFDGVNIWVGQRELFAHFCYLRIRAAGFPEQRGIKKFTDSGRLRPPKFRPLHVPDAPSSAEFRGRLTFFRRFA